MFLNNQLRLELKNTPIVPVGNPLLDLLCSNSLHFLEQKTKCNKGLQFLSLEQSTHYQTILHILFVCVPSCPL